MHSPEISVIIPAFNIEKYIERCLDSLLVQTFTDFEIVIIDDGSTDGTGRILDDYTRKYPKVSVKHIENAGVSNARNVGMNSSHGKYIVFVDGDDYLDESYLYLMHTLVEQSDVNIGIVDYYVGCGENMSPHSLSDGKKVKYSSLQLISCLGDQGMFEGYLWNKIFIKSVIDDNSIFFDTELKVWEDLDFCYRYLKVIGKGEYLHKPLYYYEQRGNSAMHSNDNAFPHYLGLKKLNGLVTKADGEFYYTIRNKYASCLAGMIGSVITDRGEIMKTLSLINKLDTDMSIKHRIKVLLFKIKCWR